MQQSAFRIAAARLLVEDQEDLRDLLADVMEGMGAQVKAPPPTPARQCPHCRVAIAVTYRSAISIARHSLSGADLGQHAADGKAPAAGYGDLLASGHPRVPAAAAAGRGAVPAEALPPQSAHGSDSAPRPGAQLVHGSRTRTRRSSLGSTSRFLAGAVLGKPARRPGLRRRGDDGTRGVAARARCVSVSGTTSTMWPERPSSLSNT